MQNHKQYQKIRSKKFLDKMIDCEWECIFCKIKDTGDEDKIREVCALLKHFEGCFIKTDSVTRILKEVQVPPAWSCVFFPKEGVEWFPIGDYYNIYLPLKKD